MHGRDRFRDRRVEDLDAPAACEAIVGTRDALLQVVSRMLASAAHWADLHNGDALDGRGRVLPAGQTPVDAYETPDPMREAMQLRHLGEVFPFSPYLGRRVDLDHHHPLPATRARRTTRPDPSRQPRPLRRPPHRLKTHGRWRIRSAGNGIHLWRSEHGWYYQVDATGTHRLTRQAGHAWWHTLTDTPERTIHHPPRPDTPNHPRPRRQHRRRQLIGF